MYHDVRYIIIIIIIASSLEVMCNIDKLVGTRLALRR